MTDLLHPDDRDDGKPWVPWQTGNEYLASLPGHRERVSMEAWYDRQRQSLLLAITAYDESMHRYQPCWAQIRLVDTGPFLQRAEIDVSCGIFAEEILAMLDLGSMPE